MAEIRDPIEVIYRSPLELVRELYGTPAYAEGMAYRPERHWTDNRKKDRVYNEVHTGNWWWRQQVSRDTVFPSSSYIANAFFTKESLPKGATVVPLIFNTDKTKLTSMSGGKEAYPAYLTIANIPKAIRRKPSSHAYRLFAYLPTVKFFTEGLSTKKKRIAKARAYHHAMRLVLNSLIEPGKNGIEFTGGDGNVRLCFPILACASLDYPEQCQVANVRYGECPICGCPPKSLEYYADCPARTQHQSLRIIKKAKVMNSLTAFDDYLQAFGIALTTAPFWAPLPRANIHGSITPDILHQIWQGLIKHLTEWLQGVVTEAELDKRLERLPPNHPIRIYLGGISSFSNMSGNEHRQVAKQILGCILGMVDAKAVRATRALLSFAYIAQYQSHTDTTLAYLEEALKAFHEDKDIFLSAKARDSTSNTTPLV